MATAGDAEPTLRARVERLVRGEVAGLGRGNLPVIVCFSDAAWRQTMAVLGCPAYDSRLASPTARRGTRGKLGMATICHLRHGHAAVVYVKTRRRSWEAIAETARHEALHVARPSYSHRQVEAALQSLR